MNIKEFELNLPSTNYKDSHFISILRPWINVGNVGEKTQLSVRPERVSLGTEGNGENVFTGKVEELIYLGDHIRVRLDVCGNNEFIVKVPNEGSFNYNEGDSIKLNWNPEDIRALDIPNQ